MTFTSNMLGKIYIFGYVCHWLGYMLLFPILSVYETSNIEFVGLNIHPTQHINMNEDQ